jgi:DNA-binding response OmpR family regulator
MEAHPTILIVDDEPLLRLLVRQVLRGGAYEVIAACSGAEALPQAVEHRPALVLMDVGMPGRSGFETVERMRQDGMTMPVLMLSCYSEVEQLVRGLQAGADDYLVKPFDARELLARVQALLRRAGVQARMARPHREARIIRLGRAVIDLEAKRAELNGVVLPVTKTEFAILECLLSAQGRPVPREQLLRAVWGYEADTNTRTVETHVWRLRKKFGDTGDTPGKIQTRSGIGYVLSAEATVPLAARV